MAAIDDYKRHVAFNILPAGMAVSLTGTDAAALARAVETGDHSVDLPSAALTSLNTALGGPARTAEQIKREFRRRGTK